MHFSVTPVKNQSGLMLPRGSSQLSTRGTGRAWQILQLIHEMQTRGTAFANPMGTGKGSGGKAAEMKGLIVVCGFPEIPGPRWEGLEGSSSPRLAQRR